MEEVFMAIQTASSTDQIPFDLSINRGVIFSNFKNIYKKKIEKRQLKLIKKLSFLKGFLSDDEEILLVTTGCSPASIIEQLFTGWVVYYLKRSLFVFTNKRIFHIPTKKDYSYRHAIAQILYADCESIAVKGRKLVFNYKNGKKEKFFYIGSREKKKIRLLLSSVSFEGPSSKIRGRVHLCPSCTKVLEEDRFVCAACRLEFKDKDSAKKISILYPGGGYFYTRHPFLGIGDAITESFLLILIIISLVDLIKGDQSSGITLGVLVLILVFEKLLTVYHANHFIKEYIPREKEISPAPSGGK
jgi:hypothetical protein